MHSEGRYAELSIRAVCILDSTVRGKHSTPALLPVSPSHHKQRRCPPGDIRAGRGPPACLSGPAQFSSCPRPAPGTSWSEQAPVLAPLLEPGHGDMNTSAAGCEAPRPPSGNYIALTNDPSEIKPLRRMFSSSEWSKSQQQQQQQQRVRACTRAR